MSIERDLERLYAVDDATAWTRDDEERLAAWAHDVLAAPPKRDFGDLADWAAEVTNFADSTAAEQAGAAAERARPTGESAAGATLRSFAGDPPASRHLAKRARRDDPARQELAARAQLHPRTGLVAVSPINPPVVGS